MTDQTELDRLRELMVDGEWRTDTEISLLTGIREGSVTAQLRHLRKAKHGSWEYIKRVREHTKSKREYRLLAFDHPQAVDLRETRASTAATKSDYASWRKALRELMVAVSVANMEDAEGDPLDPGKLPIIEQTDDMQSPVMVSRASMLEVLRLGFWLKAKVES